jgi:hypothetical protein
MDTITVGLPGTIVLSSTLPLITQTLTIIGNAGGTTISGNNSYRIMTICAGIASCSFAAGPTVNLFGLTIANGSTSGGGAGVYIVNSTVNISNTNFVGNTASANSGAGAISAGGGNLSVITSTFIGNSASQGGVIYNNSTAITITNSTFYNNSASDAGGAVYNLTVSGSGFIIENSTFHNNTAGRGGAIVNESVIILRNSTIYGNTGITATGGISNSNGTTIFQNTIVANNNGGNCANDAGAILSNGGYNIDSGDLWVWIEHRVDEQYQSATCRIWELRRSNENNAALAGQPRDRRGYR